VYLNVTAERKTAKKEKAPKMTKALPRAALRRPTMEVVERIMDLVPLLRWAGKSVCCV
jgi:hypothetical protein